MKKLLVLVLSLVTLVALTGCNDTPYSASDYFKKGDVISELRYSGGALYTSVEIDDYTVEDEEDGYMNFYYYIESAIIVLDVTSDYIVVQEIASLECKYDKDFNEEYYNTFRMKEIDTEDFEYDDTQDFDYDASMTEIENMIKDVYSNITTVEQCYVVDTYLIPFTSVYYMCTNDLDVYLFDQMELKYTDYFFSANM